MRKLHKEQILNTVETLCQACGELVALEGDSLTGLCADMQEFTSAIFDYLNGVQKGRTEELQLQELLQQAYEKLYLISCGDAKVGDMVQLCSWLREAADSLVADEIEIVFFCYKASMSDCFESVYFAAKEDEKCTPYFVPIPYFDRNPDGSFGQMHLEAEGYYSDKYELTDWKTYDVENRRPDAIFIMNPYDGNNYVTSVHPNFYSKRLRDFTDKLVYIEYGLPYWVYRNPEQISLDEYRKEGSVLPAYLHCDYVMSYSKELEISCKQTLKAYSDVAKLFQVSEKDIENRFVALGSPKFDKVIHTKREDCELPEEWKNCIRGKKVILLNSSLGEFLKASEIKETADGKRGEAGCRYFEKLQAILTEVTEREDVVLWWRPHPLLESTIRSMRNSLYQEYISMIKEFLNTGKGIFDNTEDLNRAIAWSDAMISDESSLLLLYAATGKPFYIPSISKVLETPQYDDEEDFSNPLSSRLEFMRCHKGANIGEWNICIWWDAFQEENRGWNIHYNNFVKRFWDFVVYRENYPGAKEYKQLQLQMIKDFVVNSDGTAGKKIYEFIKQKATEREYVE